MENEKNKCFSCEVSVPNDDNPDTLENITELITYCVPEMENNTDFHLPITFCESCIELLESYSQFKRKCLDWQKQLQTLLQETELPQFYEVTEKEVTEQPPEDVPVAANQEDKVVLVQYVEDVDMDQEMVDDPEGAEDYEVPMEVIRLLHGHEDQMAEVEEQQEEAEVKEKPVEEEPVRHQCPECDSTLKTKKQLNRHLINMHRDTEKHIECHLCTSMFKSFAGLQAHHARVHEGARPHICQFCGKSFKSRQEMKVHELRHGEKRGFQCPMWPECKRTFKIKREAINHLQYFHSTEKRFACTKCDMKFKTKFSLRSHEKTHDDATPFLCKLCGKGYKFALHLRHHEAGHANRRAFKCEDAACLQVGKAFNTRNLLLKHIQVAHSPPSEWKYQCEYCDRKYPQKCTFDRHVKTHTNERPFECHLCEYKSYTNRELNKHLKTHDDVKEFKCSRCPAEYRHKGTLQAHLWEQHQIGVGCNDDDLPIKLIERNFACLHCDKKYSDSVRLRNHMKTNHSDVVDNGDNGLELENVVNVLLQ